MRSRPASSLFAALALAALAVATLVTCGDPATGSGGDAALDAGIDVLVPDGLGPDTLAPDATPDTTTPGDSVGPGDVDTGGCGGLGPEGRCDGDVLSVCADAATGRVETTDCAAQQRTCAWDQARAANACIAPADNGLCGGETADGRCDGSEIVYCISADGGVGRVDCAPDYECAVVDGIAECRLPGSAGCGRVTYEGYCDGDVAVYCNWEVTEVVRYDCGVDSMGCGWVDDETGYYCVGSTGGSQTVRGAFYFEKPAVTEDGLGAVSELPIRHAIVQLRKSADDELVATGATDADGAFEIAFDAPGGEIYAVALAGADDGHYGVFVRDCPSGDCDDAGYVHAVFSEPFTPSGEVDLGGWVASLDSSAGAFNIYDVFLRGQDFAWDVYDERPPALTGQWERGAATACGALSCFSARDSAIYVLGTPADTDEFDDPVLGHELGHYLEESYSRADSPGGDHDGSPTDPRLAWGEGYGTFTGCELMGSSVYIDTMQGGASVIDIARTGLRANPNGGLFQALSEYVVAETLWYLSRGDNNQSGVGSAVVFDVLRWYFPIGWFADRGVDGVDLVDFLDGLLCRGAVGPDPIQRFAVERMRFPYDFGGPTGCQ